jgi:hypothetical protein
MKRELNPELDRIILDSLSKRYMLLEKRVGIHLSSLNYCLTKGFFDLNCPINPSDIELLNFATGYGLQELLFPVEENMLYEKEGIIYRPDGTLQVKTDDVQKLIEIKSTRSGVKRYMDGDLPATWITYMKGGCYIRNTNEYNLAVIYLSERPSARLISETITFEDQEIWDNWTWLLKRRDMYKLSISENKPVTPFTTAPSWMCDNCRYKTMCDAIVISQKGN